MSLPSGFIDMAHELLGPDTEAFLDAMRKPPAVGVRLNLRKPGAVFDNARPVKWCPVGFYLPERPSFTLDPLLHAGAYYVQDPSSMIYYELIKRICRIMGNPSSVTLLDLCAAPGGKTTAMIDALPDGSLVVANEYVAKRAAILRENLSRWGYPKATVTNRPTSHFVREGSEFDIVAVDAPCSGEGMMRKEPKAVEQWSPELIENCASLQREILADAARCVRPGGYLIYSTCTFNRKENEENLEFAVNNLGFEPIDLSFPEEWGILRGIDTPYPAYRFMPHATEGEGLFLAILHRHGSAVVDDGSEGYGLLPEKPVRKNKLVKERKVGNEIKKWKESKGGKEEVPDIDEILSVDFDRNRFPIVNVGKDVAVSYLRREAITLPPDTPRGVVIVAYKDLLLGPAKNIGTRANNLYPKNRRILRNS